MIANQQATGYDERFKFTGKERDAESGYDYFGARFLWSPIGIWLSVDPLADKYIQQSPYLYCNGNPIMLINPDGREKKNLHREDDKDCFDSATDAPDPLTALLICGHGDYRAIKDDINKCWWGAKKAAEQIGGENGFSYTFKDDAIGDKLIILYSCLTGGPPKGKNVVINKKNGERVPNFAQSLSLLLYNKLKEMGKEDQNVYVCAPSAEIKAGHRFLGLKIFRARYKGTVGYQPWVIYKNGIELLSFYISGRNPTEEIIRQKIKEHEESGK